MNILHIYAVIRLINFYLMLSENSGCWLIVYSDDSLRSYFCFLNHFVFLSQRFFRHSYLKSFTASGRNLCLGMISLCMTKTLFLNALLIYCYIDIYVDICNVRKYICYIFTKNETSLKIRATWI